MVDARYSDAPSLDEVGQEADVLASMLGRGSCRAFLDQPVPSGVLDVLCAASLASPTKSDLQQRDIILLAAPQRRAQIAGLVSGQGWVADAPMIAVFCGNNRRQRLLHDWHEVPFANDHLDAVINATADAAIALGAFVTAAEALGLGCCPISAVRNRPEEVSALLGLPQHVFPFAGLAFGYPAGAPDIAKRLPLRVTCHVDEYREDNLRNEVAAYDADRARTHPYAAQRFVEIFGEKDTYGWSDDKVRQYSQKERDGFGAYLRAQGFRLE
jgi:nitroreductase/FMN reductase [NAD(P)H]